MQGLKVSELKKNNKMADKLSLLSVPIPAFIRRIQLRIIYSIQHKSACYGLCEQA